MPAYDEILDFVTSAPTLQQIIDFAHSDATLERVEYLTEAETNDSLSDEERAELREFRRASEFMDELKIRARRRIADT